MKTWIMARLSRKVAVAVAAILATSSLAFLVLFVGLYRSQLEDERSLASERINRLLQASLENAMVKRDIDGLQLIVSRLGEQEGIADVMILDPTREIRFASDPAMLGEHLPEEPVEAQTRFTSDAKGREVLRSVNPVRNKPVCTQCHGPIADHPVNGILFVDYEADAIRGKALTSALTLAGSGGLVLVLTLGLLTWVLQRLVVAPVSRLDRASARIAAGDLAARVPADDCGGDEVARLGASFNRMAASLEETTAARKRQQDFLQALIDGMPDGIRVIDAANYRIVAANRAYAEQVGADLADLAGRQCYESSHGRDGPCAPTLVTCPLHALTVGGQTIKAVYRHLRGPGHEAAGEAFFVEVTAAAVGVPDADGTPRRLIVESIRDMTADIDMSHAQRLSEMAQLATGVAHEVHNPLVAIRMALEGIARAGVADGEVVREPRELARYLSVMRDHVDQCITVSERLLNLAHLPTEGAVAVAVGPALEDAVALLRYEAAVSGVTVDLQAPAVGTAVLATGPELRMVAINLMQNAFHAMPEGGRLTVEVRPAGGMVEIGFTDSGVGIAPDRLRRIFDPYYSARADGAQGTGMGLSICRSIIETYGGTIAVDSTLGEGSTFRIRLPVCEAPAAPVPPGPPVRE
jgi:signal transduction histidine kinase